MNMMRRNRYGVKIVNTFVMLIWVVKANVTLTITALGMAAQFVENTKE